MTQSLYGSLSIVCKAVFKGPFHTVADLDSIDEPFHTNANATEAVTARERDEEHHQLGQSHDILAAQLVEIRAAMDTQGTLLKRILEWGGGSVSEG